MSDGSHDAEHSSAASFRAGSRGMTLPELLVAITIILLIFSLVFLTAKTVLGSSRRTRAQAQLQLLAAAIDRYALAWPVWRDASGNPVADRAWPHWSPWALFPTQGSGLTLPPLSSSYDYNSPNCGMLYPVPPNPTPIWTPADDDAIDAVGQFTGRNDVGQASACLAYSLFTPALGQTIMKDDSGVFTVVKDREYPALGGRTTAIRVTLDPWGHPVRYFWVVRDSDSSNSTGWRPVTSANPADRPPPAVTDPPDPFYLPAQGYVLESAGPDGRFGYQWKRNATPQELTDAADNLVVQP